MKLFVKLLTLVSIVMAGTAAIAADVALTPEEAYKNAMDSQEIISQQKSEKMKKELAKNHADEVKKFVKACEKHADNPLCKLDKNGYPKALKKHKAPAAADAKAAE